MRLAFSVAIEVDPDILIIDEILGVGDAGFQQKCFDRIQRFRDAGKTIILVSHAMDNMRKFCSRLLLIHNGAMLEDGPPDRVIDRYEELIGQRAPLSVRK
jgi:ABC-type polysaccharide/polyol phosphate transport system ATPase subunit